MERSQIFTDCIHLLTLHEPGNELRIIAEVSVPGGNIDFCLLSVRDKKVVDFVGIELQTVDTTGTVWPERQRFVQQHGVRVNARDVASQKSFGMNWKMTAKTALVQLHHKIETFEHIGKRLVLVAQDQLIAYMRREFTFEHLQSARLGDPMHFHAYALLRDQIGYRLQLQDRWSTDAQGIAQCLGLQVSANVELESILRQLESKLPQSTLLSIEHPVPAAPEVPPSDD